MQIRVRSKSVVALPLSETLTGELAPVGLIEFRLLSANAISVQKESTTETILWIRSNLRICEDFLTETDQQRKVAQTSFNP